MASPKGAASLVEPPHWSDECLEADRTSAIAVFREERLKEPVEAYTDQFESARDAFDELLETTVDFTLLAQNAMDVLAEAKFLEAVRYVVLRPEAVRLVDSVEAPPGAVDARRGVGGAHWAHVPLAVARHVARGPCRAARALRVRRLASRPESTRETRAPAAPERQ